MAWNFLLSLGAERSNPLILEQIQIALAVKLPRNDILVNSRVTFMAIPSRLIG